MGLQQQLKNAQSRFRSNRGKHIRITADLIRRRFLSGCHFVFPSRHISMLFEIQNLSTEVIEALKNVTEVISDPFCNSCGRWNRVSRNDEHCAAEGGWRK